MTTPLLTAAPQSAPAAPPKRSRWSFSLLTLLLATGLVMAVISHVRTSRILEDYRAKSDELEIESPRRIHVRRMNHTNHNVWRWRVFLPEGYHFFLNVATKAVSEDKLPPIETRRMFDAYGEVIVDVFAADMINGTPYDNVYVVTIMSDFAGGGSVTTRAFHVDVPGSNFMLAYEETAVGRTLSFAPDEPVVLFRGVNHGTPQSPTDPSAEPGIILWIEQAAPSP
jgi:hypothetical protein